MRHLIASLALLFSPYCWSAPIVVDANCNGTSAAKLTSLQGQAFYDPGIKGQWRPVKLNDNLCEGGRIRVAALSRVAVQLPSGILLRLDENTVITLNIIKPNKPNTLDMLKGFVHFISRTPRRLSINTPIANGGPEGTEFAMQVDDTQALLWVYEGEVKLFNAKGSINVLPGNGAQSYKNQSPHTYTTVKPQDAVNWALNYPLLLPSTESSSLHNGAINNAIHAFQSGNTTDALLQLNALTERQRTPFFFEARAAMRLALGRVELAEQDINVLLAHNINNAEAWALQSVLALTQNRTDEALARATQALAANAKSAMAYAAMAYAQQGRFKLNNALEAATQAVKFAPYDALGFARKAELELSLGLLDASEQSTQQALRLDATLEKTQTMRGFAALLHLKTNDAMQCFKTAIQLNSTSPLAHVGLGLTKIRLGDLKAGREALEIAVSLDPSNSLLRSYLGKAYYEEKRNPLAADEFGLAKQYDGKDPTPYFYDALLKQATNRPVEALQAMQHAITLNDNRGVYRSRLLLDDDKAVRSASLGRIYKELGMDDVARLQATQSLGANVSHYSAHRLLADTYFYRPRQEIARASELLQAQLLQPLNFNPMQPQLAYTDLNIAKSAGFTDTAFNEYSQLFEGNQQRFTATGVYGSNDTRSDEAALSGIYNKLAYSFGQMHYQTDGFRPNADVKHNLYNAFVQYEMSPKLSVQAEYRHRETEQGDIEMRGSARIFDATYRRKLHQDTYRVGAKYSPTQHADVLGSFIYADRHENIQTVLNPTAGLTLNSMGGHKSYQLESQYLYHNEYINMAIGGGAYHVDDKTMTQIYVNKFKDLSLEKDTFGYGYANITVDKNLLLTAGLAYDHYRDDMVAINQFSPKLGLQWRINDALTLRAAGFQTVKTPIIVNQMLQPMQIAGFNQFFDDPNGTRATQYGVGLDVKPTKNSYAGVEAYTRDLKMPLSDRSVNTTTNSTFFIKREEELYRLYFNWMPHVNWVVNSELRFENFHGQKEDSHRHVQTAYLPLTLRFFNEIGFFADVTGHFIHQSMIATAANDSPGAPTDNPNNFTSNFFLLDAAMGYRFPKRYGMISLEAKNLLNKNFKYRDRNFQLNEIQASYLIPERLLFARLTLNF